MDLAKPRVERSPVFHHVDLAHQENHVNRSVEVQLRLPVVDANDLDLAVDRGRRAEHRVELQPGVRPPTGRARLGRGARGLAVRRHVQAVLRERGCEKLGVVTGTRSDVEHGHRRREAEECERLHGVAVLVAICGAGSAVQSAQGGGDRGTAGGDAGVRRRACGCLSRQVGGIGGAVLGTTRDEERCRQASRRARHGGEHAESDGTATGGQSSSLAP